MAGKWRPGKFRVGVRLGAMAWLVLAYLALAHAASLPSGFGDASPDGDQLLQASVVADMGALPPRIGDDGGSSGEGFFTNGRCERLYWIHGAWLMGSSAVLAVRGDAAVRRYLRQFIDREPGRMQVLRPNQAGKSDSEPPCLVPPLS